MCFKVWYEAKNPLDAEDPHHYDIFSYKCILLVKSFASLMHTGPPLGSLTRLYWPQLKLIAFLVHSVCSVFPDMKYDTHCFS